MNSLRRTAVRVVKPRVSPATWDRLRAVATRAVPPSTLLRPVADPTTTIPRTPPRLPPGLHHSLENLAAYYGTDKWGLHRYAQHYSRHFRHLRRTPFAMLEIGIGGYRHEGTGGASLRMWKHFFRRAQIVGLDIYDKSFVDQDRITTYQGSQTDEILLRRINKAHGPFRIVVDDGSHRPEHIRATFATLFPLLADDGFYVIEDTQTSYWPRWGGSLDLDDPATTMALVKDLVDGLNYEEFGDTKPRRYSDSHVVAVHCYHNVVIVQKGTNHEGSQRPANWATVKRPAAI